MESVERGRHLGYGCEGPVQIEAREILRAEHRLEGRVELGRQVRKSDLGEIYGGVPRQLELPPNERQERRIPDAIAPTVHGVIDVVEVPNRRVPA